MKDHDMISTVSFWGLQLSEARFPSLLVLVDDLQFQSSDLQLLLLTRTQFILFCTLLEFTFNGRHMCSHMLPVWCDNSMR